MKYYGTISDPKDMVTKEYVDSHSGGGLSIDDIYPVGSIYMSVNSTNPETLFSGTRWTQIQDTFLLAAGTNHSAGSTGGAETVTLTSAQSGVPAHSHGKGTLSVPSSGSTTTNSTSKTLTGKVDFRNIGSGNTEPYGWYHTASSNAGIITRASYTWSGSHANFGASTTVSNPKVSTMTIDATHTHGVPNHTHTVSGDVANNTAADATTAHENMPPYLTVYMWQRTS